MFKEIKSKIDNEISSFCRGLKKDPVLKSISPLLFAYIEDFIQRDGKRLRPILFVSGYLGFSKKEAPGLYRSAISIELLHDFMLVHDDIIDKSDTRRGKPSMHKMFNTFLSRYKGLKFNGQDLAIVAGDVIYALGLEAFLAVHEEKARKEMALRQLIKAALYTGSGEFIELLAGANPIEKITLGEIYKVYDYKTAYYSFSSPLAIGAILAGADPKEVAGLIKYGIYVGRAFQIKDDIIGMFSEEKEIGKSVLADLQEAKKTILTLKAFKNARPANKSLIKKTLNQKISKRKDLLLMRKLILESGALDYAKDELFACTKKAEGILLASKIKPLYKKEITSYSRELLKV